MEVELFQEMGGQGNSTTFMSIARGLSHLLTFAPVQRCYCTYLNCPLSGTWTALLIDGTEWTEETCGKFWIWCNVWTVNLLSAIMRKWINRIPESFCQK
jgi:hypothetical protein